MWITANFDADKATLSEFVPFACFNAWGCQGFEGYVFTGVVPVAVVVVGALLAQRWSELPVVALVGLSCAIAAEYLIYSFDYGPAEGIELLSGWRHFAGAYLLMLIVAATAHVPKRAVPALLRWRRA